MVQWKKSVPKPAAQWEQNFARLDDHFITHSRIINQGPVLLDCRVALGLFFGVTLQTPSQPTFIHNVEIVIAHPFRGACYYSSHHGRTRDKAQGPRMINPKPGMANPRNFATTTHGDITVRTGSSRDSQSLTGAIGALQPNINMRVQCKPQWGTVIEATPDQCKTDEMYRNLGAGTTRHLNHARSNVARTSHQFQKQLAGSHSGGESLSREVHRFRPPGGVADPVRGHRSGLLHVLRSALRAASFWRSGHFTHHANRPVSQARASRCRRNDLRDEPHGRGLHKVCA
jgi:hypothetical protein